MHPVDTRHLRHLLMLAKYRNFRKAAEALFITQPALTKSIKLLEDQLGVLLFDRRPQSVDPTPYCEVVLEHARRVMQELDQIHHSLDSLSKELRGELRIGSGPIIARGPVSDSIARLVGKHPGLSIHVTIDSWAALLQQLRSGEIHMMIADTGSMTDCDDLEILPLPTTKSVAACRKGHPLLGKGIIEPGDLLKYPLAAPFLPHRWIEWLRENAPKDTDPDFYLSQAWRVRCESFSLLNNVTLNSNFITCAPMSLLKDHLEKGDLVQIPFPGFTDIEVQPGIVCLRKSTLPPAAISLQEQLLDNCAEG